MSQRLYKIRGSRDDSPRRNASTVAQPLFRLHPGSARDGAADEIEVAGDNVVRVELDNGFVLWSRVDDLSREYGTAPARDGDGSWEFTRLTPRRGAGQRGVAGLAIRVLDFFGVDLVEKSAAKIGKELEEKLLGKHPPGLYQLDLNSAFALHAVPETAVIPGDQGPLLVFLHGTASSCAGSFGKLWEAGNNEGNQLRQALAPIYGERVFALEHRSLTESPIRNALDLARRLPAGAEVHLVSHSRGGLVGELLCLSGCANLTTILDAERLKTLFAADRSLAPQLGLAPLDDSDSAARDAAYDADRLLLTELVQTLTQKQLRIDRFVRVACPARGTTLASGRLDRWLSVLGYLGNAVSGGGLLGDGVDFMLAVVKERTDPRTLPGIEAMMPGSALTRLLNGTAELASSADLSVIAGDIETGDSLWNTLKVLASDWFYKNEHDLVVDTASMSGGLPRLGGARYRQDKGSKVNHFRYFTNEQSVRWLRAGLTRNEGDHAGFLPIAPPPATAAHLSNTVGRSRDGNPSRPIVIVLPGTMGSQLQAGDETIWPDYQALLKGGLRHLAMGNQGIVPVALVSQRYGPLVEFLARSHQVEIFPYDWRLSLRQTAERLAATLEPLVSQAERSKQPLRLLAHSTGGLVARAMIADGGAGSALWKRITRLPGSRLLMLGTPNFGSYEAVRWLSGSNPTQAKLSLLDISHDIDRIIALVARYPGLLELLPWAPEDPDFSDPARWQALRLAIGASWPSAEASDLQAAAETWKFLRSAAPDPQFMAYVAGSQPATIIDYQLSPAEIAYRPDLKRLEFIATRQGDGMVSWESGRLPGVPMWYAEDTAHDMLCAQSRLFPAYLEILLDGRSSLLPSTPPSLARGADGTERFVLPATPPSDGIPGPGELPAMGFSGCAAESADDSEHKLPTIEVCIRHGNLTYARHPVMVGHYQGDAVVSAEGALDRQLGGHLTRCLDLGIYPGPLGSHSTFLNDSALARPAGAIVVGLGQIGGLSPGLLEESIHGALLDFTLKVAYWPDARFGEDGRRRSAAITSLLIGTGAGGVPVGDALEAILRAVISANKALAAHELDKRVLIDRLEILELYEDVAIEAAEALRRILGDENLGAAINWPADAVETAQAGRRRIRFETVAEWYQRLEIVLENNRLRFLFPTDKARAEESLATGQLALADSFVRIASRDTGQNSEAAKTLFEMLLPLRLRELAPQQGNVVVVVDAGSARYPWELLENRWASGERPPAVASGFIRQLRTAEFRQRPVHSLGNSALVIGNPDLHASAEFADLPGARDEATLVAEQLAADGYDVLDCIDQEATNIMEALHKNSWRILHLAGHGVYTPAKGNGRPQSGMVIGPDSLLTPGDIAQMRFVPELVFVNCCHLGLVEGGRDIDRLGLAANLGEEFIRMGVRGVIAAGWAVDDRAGQAFAATFYRQMLAGETFGEAVRSARENIWLRFPDVNTWGAYQCYGDPDFRFHRDNIITHRHHPAYAVAHELVTDLDNLTADLRAGSAGAVGSRDIPARLARIPATQKDIWLQRADVQTALGFAWGEAGDWETAITCLEMALTAEQGNCSMRALEQYANFRIRQADELWQEASRQAPNRREKTRRMLLDGIQAAILDLAILCQRAPSAERLSLLGDAYKRLARIEVEGPLRTEALLNMAEHYRLAYQRRHDACAFGNWQAASRLGELRGEAPVGPTTNREQELDTLLRDVAQRTTDNPGFPDSAKLAELQLLRLLLVPATGKRQSPETAGGIAVLNAYRNAIARGASRREISQVAEHIAFLLDLWPSKDKARRAILEQIQELLS